MYDYKGLVVNDSSSKDSYYSIEYHRDSETGAFYITVLIPQTLATGEKQYPFVIWPNYPNGGIQSALEMNRDRKFLVATNGSGVFPPWGAGVTETGVPIGIVIQNGVFLGNQGGTEPYHTTLTIDSNGMLGYADQSATAEELIARGVKSTISGYYPIVYDYNDFDSFSPAVAEHLTTSQGMTGDAQRQAICQYENGDYLIITSEGRGFNGSGYFTGKKMQSICKQYGVKFAYMLDGGGSAETVIGQKQLNMIYENTYGRRMATYLVFNGTDKFKLSNA